MTIVTPEAELEVIQLAERLQLEGQASDELSWREREIDNMLLIATTGVRFLVENRAEQPSLVSRLIGKGLLSTLSAVRLPEVILRFQGKPDETIKVGKSVDIQGLSKRNPILEPGVLLRTPPLVEIRYLAKP